jgi:hypothetical protein
MGKQSKKKSSTVSRPTDDDPYVKKDDFDLFDNPMTRAALDAMSEEEKQRYKNIGEELYGHLDFNDGKVLKQLPPPMAEAIAYLCEQLKSGLHPSMMEENEQAVMSEGYGEKWYENWGYVEGDLTDIVTVKQVDEDPHE